MVLTTGEEERERKRERGWGITILGGWSERYSRGWLEQALFQTLFFFFSLSTRLYTLFYAFVCPSHTYVLTYTCAADVTCSSRLFCFCALAGHVTLPLF